MCVGRNVAKENSKKQASSIYIYIQLIDGNFIFGAMFPLHSIGFVLVG